MLRFKEKLLPFLKWSRSQREISTPLVIIGLSCSLAAAFGLRLLTLYAEPALSRDGVGYVQQARELLTAKFATDKVSPPVMPTVHYFYAFYLSSQLFSLDPWTLGVTTNIVLGSFLPLLFFGLAQHLWGNKELSLACAAIAAVQPNLVAYSIEVQREIPHIFFAGCFGLCCMLFYKYVKWYWDALMGCAASLSMIFRYEGAELFFLALIPFGILLQKKQISRRQLILYWGIFVFFSVFTLWLLLCWLNVSLLAFIQAAFQKAFSHMRFY